MSAVGGKKNHGGTITINNKAFDNGPPDSDKRQLSGGRGTQMETALNPTRLVGLGSMFGAILETSGGAQSIAVTMVKKFGDEKAVWALGITGLVIAMPVFCAVRLP